MAAEALHSSEWKSVLERIRKDADAIAYLTQALVARIQTLKEEELITTS